MKSTEIILARNILKSQYDITPDKVVGVYPYGSILYNTITDKSDLDLVVIVDMVKNDYLQYESEDLDIHFLSINYYNQLLQKHDIMALECYFNKTPYLAYETEFKLDLPTLRKSISHVASNSWVKAKKKVNLEDEDDYIGYKSLFHSFRIPILGTQIARFGEIKNFRDGNVYWTRIMGMVDHGSTIEQILAVLKPDHNKVMSDFRELAPKQ